MNKRMLAGIRVVTGIVSIILLLMALWAGIVENSYAEACWYWLLSQGSIRIRK